MNESVVEHLIFVDMGEEIMVRQSDSIFLFQINNSLQSFKVKRFQMVL